MSDELREDILDRFNEEIIIIEERLDEDYDYNTGMVDGLLRAIAIIEHEF